MNVLTCCSVRGNSQTSKFCYDLVVFGWVEAYGDTAGPFFIQEVDESQEDPGTGVQTDVLYVGASSFIHADPGPCTD